MKIIIGGAGIAGLSLANFFEQNSIDYLILEKRTLLDDRSYWHSNCSKFTSCSKKIKCFQRY